MEDDEIIRLYFSRDEGAIKETSDKYGTSLHRLSLSITENESDAQECVNDTYLEAWRRIPPVNPDCLFAWLARVVRSFSCRVWERQNALKRRGNIVELTEELAQCIPGAGSVETALENRALSDCIDRFVRGLDKDARLVFMRRYFWSMSLEEISELTGYSQSKLKSMLFRARNKLKAQLERENLL